MHDQAIKAGGAEAQHKSQHQVAATCYAARRSAVVVIAFEFEVKIVRNLNPHAEKSTDSISIFILI